MINSWSLLFDELNMTKNSTHYSEDKIDIKLDGYSVNGIINQEYWEDDGIGLIDNSLTGQDTISQNFKITIPTGSDTITFNSNMTTDKDRNRFKYSEDRILKELTDYISATYNQHYSAGDDKIQTLDLIEACGDGESFCRSNILKYASRYDKKGTARRDIMKILHYAVLLLHFNDKNAKRETYPQ